MYLIGLTGGIAAGKSTIARRLVEHGAVHIDADQLARRVVEKGAPGLERVREAFGDSVMAADGTLDRAALGQRVFGDPEALARLNGMLHPLVRSLSETLIARAATENPDAVVVYDVPLLVEAQVNHPFDLIVVADAATATRVQRLVEIRGMDPEQALARVESQAGDAERLRIADVVISTDGSMAHTVSETDALWARIRSARGAATE